MPFRGDYYTQAKKETETAIEEAAEGLSKLEEVFDRVYRPQELGLRLRHDDSPDVAIPRVQLEWKSADVAFVADPRDRLAERKATECREHEKGSEHRVAGKRNLLSRREDSDPGRGSRIRRRHHEDGLGEIHLAGDLPFLVGGDEPDRHRGVVGADAGGAEHRHLAHRPVRREHLVGVAQLLERGVGDLQIAAVGRDEGIEITGDIGVTSHAGDLLRRAAIPSRLAAGPVTGT